MKVKHLENTPERTHYTFLKSENLRLKPKVLYAGTSRYEEPWQEQMHCHDFLEVLYVKQGFGHAQVGEEIISIASGDIVIYNPGIQHYEWTEGEQPFETVFFGAANIGLEGLQENQFPAVKNPIRTGEEKDVFEKLFTALAEESENNLLYTATITEHYVATILLKVLRLFTYGEEAYLRINDAYLKAKRYIDQHFCEITDMETLCKKLFVSRYHLTHLFQAYSGMSPLQYLIEKRINHASRLLVTTDLPVKQIAAQNGYAEVGSFIKAFKRVTGQTPTAYRKQHRSM